MNFERIGGSEGARAVYAVDVLVRAEEPAGGSGRRSAGAGGALPALLPIGAKAGAPRVVQARALRLLVAWVEKGRLGGLRSFCCTIASGSAPGLALADTSLVSARCSSRVVFPIPSLLPHHATLSLISALSSLPGRRVR